MFAGFGAFFFLAERLPGGLVEAAVTAGGSEAFLI